MVFWNPIVPPAKPLEPGRQTTAPLRPRRLPGGPVPIYDGEERRQEQIHPHPGRRHDDLVPGEPHHDVDVEV